LARHIKSHPTAGAMLTESGVSWDDMGRKVGSEEETDNEKRKTQAPRFGLIWQIYGKLEFGIKNLRRPTSNALEGFSGLGLRNANQGPSLPREAQF